MVRFYPLALLRVAIALSALSALGFLISPIYLRHILWLHDPDRDLPKGHFRSRSSVPSFPFVLRGKSDKILWLADVNSIVWYKETFWLRYFTFSSNLLHYNDVTNLPKEVFDSSLTEFEPRFAEIPSGSFASRPPPIESQPGFAIDEVYVG